MHSELKKIETREVLRPFQELTVQQTRFKLFAPMSQSLDHRCKKLKQQWLAARHQRPNHGTSFVALTLVYCRRFFLTFQVYFISRIELENCGAIFKRQCQYKNILFLFFLTNYGCLQFILTSKKKALNNDETILFYVVSVHSCCHKLQCMYFKYGAT